MTAQIAVLNLVSYLFLRKYLPLNQPHQMFDLRVRLTSSQVHWMFTRK